MADIEIKRGYEVLSDNNVGFGIRVINNSDSAILDVEVILDYSESLFDLDGDKILKLDIIPPAVPRTAKFMLKPRGCIHKEEIAATIRYKDHQWKRHTLEMHPKEVHCVCPFLKEKSITRARFLTLLDSGYIEERGINFEGITVDKVLDFLFHTCKNRLYRVDEFPIENGAILYLAGDALGEKAYYLLTAVVKEYDSVTQVLLRANSDKSHGLNGFLNEILDNLRQLVLNAEAREIGIIKKEQVTNIIGSVAGDYVTGGKQVIGGDIVTGTKITGDVVATRSKIGGNENIISNEGRIPDIRENGAKKRQETEEKRTREEEERKAREKAERKEREEQEKLRREEQERIWREEEEKKERERKAKAEWEKKAREEAERKEGERLRKKKEEQKKLAEHGNSIGMKFTLIPAGEFMMGSEKYDDEKPMHKVKLRKPFYLGAYPVTQREWKAVMGDNPSYFKGDSLPVEQVSWSDVQKFIRKLNAKEGTDKYRRPSEAEWEYACRAGTTTRYSFADSESKLGDYAWYDDNSGDKTHPVGQKKPNPYGLYDMHGNVWEWVQDKYRSDYDGAPTDGSAWESGDGAFRVGRGGSWLDDARNCRSADRGRIDPGNRSSYFGFRLFEGT
jgi:formylglycine-generating enzyme required for sulfatase activity